MTKLKTLKDIDKLVFNTDYTDWKQLEKTNDNNYVLLERKAVQGMKDVLKAEAIKWIKFLKSNEYYEHVDDDELFFGDPTDISCWIEKFFNITDKDLE